ncbi:PAS domain S-box protein [Rhizobium sp. WYCCWR 11279]|uniref:sensor histidine kinase n=1 Tax=Rhizobium changzhiense TaxID=2692317 RepID=UPI001491B189|nr:HWE histidine kinase domain-containing protein [Rhizobium changzhiense]NNU48855.1 PAS domain S-box protein [Rhizobium changzhiense]
MTVVDLQPRPARKPASGFSALAAVDQDVLDAVPIAIAVFDRFGGIVRLNKSASVLLHLPPHVDNSTAVNLALADDSGPAQGSLARSIIAESTPRYGLELTLVSPDGARRALLADIEPLFESSFAATGAIACLRDVTDSKLAAEAALAQQKDIEDFFENGAVGLHLVSSEGVILRANQAELKLLGYEKEEYIGQPIARFHADGDVIEDILRRLSLGESLHRHPARLKAKDGSIRHVEITSNANFGAQGFKNTRCFTVDVSDQFETAAAARATEQNAREVLEALPAAIYTTDAEGRVTFFNQAAVAFSGRTPVIGTDEWCVTWRLYEADGTPLPHDQCPMAVSLREGRPIRGVQAIAERPDGSLVPFMPYPTPLFDADGKVIGGINMLVDISALKDAEREQRILIDELNHRVKNTLSTVQSISAQTLRSTPEPTQFAPNFQDRIIALAKAHDLLTKRRWTGVSLGELVDQEVGPFVGPDPYRLVLDGPEITLSPRIGLALGMVLHELASNARQFGSLQGESGVVRLKWTLSKAEDGPSRLQMSWVEHGGPEVTVPSRHGFGCRLIERSITDDLDGSVKVNFPASGFRCELEFPLP